MTDDITRLLVKVTILHSAFVLNMFLGVIALALGYVFTPIVCSGASAIALFWLIKTLFKDY